VPVPVLGYGPGEGLVMAAYLEVWTPADQKFVTLAALG
jgi:hypothetical protein